MKDVIVNIKNGFYWIEGILTEWFLNKESLENYLAKNNLKLKNKDD